MANPGGYPMQPMGNPMGHGGPPQGARTAMVSTPKRGTPKAVPVIVSAGLAVGVFCGLLFGLGTGTEVKAAGNTSEKKFVGTKIEGTEDTTSTTPNIVPPKSVTDGKPATPATGSANAAGAGSGAGSGSAMVADGSGAGSAVPTVKTAKLTVEIKPEAIASTAKIVIDGSEITTREFEVTLGEAAKKEVKVLVKASGYKDVEQKVEVEGDTTLKVELVKRSSGGGLKRPDPPGGSGRPGGKKPKKPGGGGLIDI
ncbi:MAG: hypothetical protein H0T89_32745 [Deltaproteobacteria bacterium]|nr:hypothetical protein [Deltaproteobacteria bacterium]MDQ3301644.1 hypothetical protein [Myxococcota bacterium]